MSFTLHFVQFHQVDAKVCESYNKLNKKEKEK